MRDHPEATGWILYGAGQGNFRKTEVVIGHGWHEACLADLDGDGDLDLLDKPYTWDAPRMDVWLNSGTRATVKGVGTSKSFHGPVGLQLYSLRDIFAGNVPMGLQTTRGFGFREVALTDTYGWTPMRLRQMLDCAGLKPVSSIMHYDFLNTSMDQTIADARTLGVKYLGTAGYPKKARFTEAGARKAAADFNRFGEALAKAGIKFFYRNHGFEFVRHGNGTLFDLIVQETKPEFVTFAMDVFRTVHSGLDPVTLLKKHPNRWSILHVMDMKKIAATGKLTGSDDARNDVPLGSGQIDLVGVLKTGQELGVKHFIIDDESPSVTDHIPPSLRYLEALAW